METEASFRAPAGTPWRTDPFRLFFVLGVLLSWVGVGHWLLYALGVTTTYSCELHSMVQMQAFMMSFAVGFLLTALPRRTQSPPPTTTEILVIAAALTATTVAAAAERWAAGQIGYAIVFATLIRFALSRFLGARAGRRPPAAFVLIPLAILHGLLGALGIFADAQGLTPRWAIGFGLLLVQQGVFLCLVVGIGSLILPLMAGAPPPPDLGSSPAEARKAFLYGAVGIAIFSSLLLEQLGFAGAGQLLRAVVVIFGLALGGQALRTPGKPGLHRRLVWLSVWMIPLGLVTAALLPDYRVPALHIFFIGGFGLMAFGVASHVAMAHLGMEALALGRPWPVVAIALTFGLSLLARLAADASESYFSHLGWAAALWITGSALWLGFFAPAFLRASSPQS